MKLEIQENACGLARKLIADGLDPDELLEFYRGDVLCLRGKAGGFAKLRVQENENVGPKFVPWEPIPPEKKAALRSGHKVKDGFKTIRP